jgi:hypothetical protein
MTNATELKHWTNKGTFKIEQVFVGGSWNYRLWHNETDLGLYNNPYTAARSIGEGQHDQTLGFSASLLGVPPTLKDWNGFR